jgi:amino acid efflux transporter
MALTVKNQPAAPQHLTTSRGAALYIGALLGPGLLLLPGLAAAEAGPASILAWLGLLILSGLFAAVFSALGRHNPSAGGVIGYVTAGLGSRAGRATGWMFLAGVVCGAPIVCFIGASYVTELTGGSQLARAAVAAALLLIVVGLAAGGLRASATAQLVLVSLLVVVVIVAAAGSAGTARVSNWTPFAPHGWLSIGSAAATLMFSFVGWEAVAPLTTRFANPGRQLPRVVAIALAVTTALYLGLAVATISVLGPQAASDVPLADLLSHAIGAAGPDIAAVAAIVLTLGATNAYINGAAAMVRQLAPAAPGHRGGGPVFRLLAAITGTGLLLIVLYGLRIVSTAELVAVPTALFLSVYLGAMASAARELRGAVRLAALPAALAVLAMLGFCGWALAIPAAVALATGWRTRPVPSGTAPAPPPSVSGAQSQSPCSVNSCPHDDLRSATAAAWLLPGRSAAVREATTVRHHRVVRQGPGRDALVSNPAPSRTACRTPSAHAPVISSSRNTVRATIHNRSAAACLLVARLRGDPVAATNAAASGSANSRSGRAVSSARIPATVSPVPLTPSSILGGRHLQWPPGSVRQRGRR